MPLNRKKQLGLTWFEVLTTLIIVAVLGATLLDRLRYYQEMAEKALMQRTLGALSDGMRYRAAELLIAGNGAALDALQQDNPFRWVVLAGEGYCGEWQQQGKAGCWYYHGAVHEVLYYPRNRRYLHGLGRGEPLRFRWPAGLSAGQVMRARMQAVLPYTWSKERL